MSTPLLFYAAIFRHNPGIHRGVFECPEVFRIQEAEDPNITKWILMLSVGDRNGVNPKDPELSAGGSGMMYFIGNFDGKSFTLDETLESLDAIYSRLDNYLNVTATIPHSVGNLK